MTSTATQILVLTEGILITAKLPTLRIIDATIVCEPHGDLQSVVANFIAVADRMTKSNMLSVVDMDMQELLTKMLNE